MSDAQKTPRLPPVTLNTSQDPSEATSTRLPTPSQQRFCEPCKAFLRGDSTECFGSDKWGRRCDHEYIHHFDAASFQQALELPCAICVRLYKAFQSKSDSWNQTAYSTGPTHYYFHHLNYGPSFKSHDLEIHSNLSPYESRPELHYQHITQNTADAGALAFLKNQYSKCREQHSKCQRIAPYNEFTPTRTIHVGSAEEEVVRLCDSVDMTAGAAYTVLSHCWGKNPQHIMLTKSTVEMLKTGIALSSLPKTFQDAIAITRIFEIQYVWIDSLCIFQDDLHDWATEASHMRDVYRKAELCIAATGAESGDVGLFFDRDSEQLTPVMVEATWPSDDVLPSWPMPGSYLFGYYDAHPGKAIEMAPLNQRAWVAQERLLSPRTLHFTQSLLFWECHTSFINENNLNSGFMQLNSKLNSLRMSLHDVQSSESNLEPIQNTALHSISNDTKISNIYIEWRRFLTHYTLCGITKESDILVALVGVADEVGDAIKDCLIAGLWKAQFIQQLSWRAWGNTSRPNIWRAPSWSWASLSGQIVGGMASVFADKMAAVIEIHVSTKPSGEVEQGSVLMECRLLSATIHCRRSRDDHGSYNACGTLNESVWTSFTEEIDLDDEKLIRVQLDVEDDRYYHAGRTVDVQLLVLSKLESSQTLGIVVTGICVVNSGNQDDAFERVGYFQAWEETAELVLAAYDQARVQKILLV